MASSSRCGCRSPAVSAAAAASSCISTSGGAGGGPSGGALALSPRRRDAPSCFMAGRAGPAVTLQQPRGTPGVARHDQPRRLHRRQARAVERRAPEPVRLLPTNARVFPPRSRAFPADARVFPPRARVVPAPGAAHARTPLGRRAEARCEAPGPASGRRSPTGLWGARGRGPAPLTAGSSHGQAAGAGGAPRAVGDRPGKQHCPWLRAPPSPGSLRGARLAAPLSD